MFTNQNPPTVAQSSVHSHAVHSYMAVCSSIIQLKGSYQSWLLT